MSKIERALFYTALTVGGFVLLVVALVFYLTYGVEYS